MFSLSVQDFQPAANIRSRSLFREDLLTQGRFPDLFREDLSIRRKFLLPETEAPRQHLLSVQSQPWTVAFGGCTFSGDFAGAPLVNTGECPVQSGYLDLNSKGITSISVGVFANMGQLQ